MVRKMCLWRLKWHWIMQSQNQEERGVGFVVLELTAYFVLIQKEGQLLIIRKLMGLLHVQDMSTIKFKKQGTRFKYGFHFHYLLIFSLFFQQISGLALFSCSGKVESESSVEKSFTWESIPATESLSGKKHFFKQLKMPGRLLYKNDKLVVLDDAAEDNFLHLLESNSLKYLSASGAKGLGPGEIPSGWTIESGPEPDTFWVYSLEGKSLSEYPLEFSDDTRALRQIKQQGNLFRALGMTWSSDSTLVTFLVDGSEKFVEFHVDGSEIVGFGTWQGMIPGDYDDHVIADLHQGTLAGDPEKGKFIKASILRDRLEILDKQSEIIIGVNGPENSIPEFRPAGSGVVTSSNHPLAYMDVFLGKEHIFGLYSGKSDQEIMEHGGGETTLLVFTITGDIEAVFRLDIPISAFSVDEARHRIFGITADRDPGLAVFDYALK
jgi:hypothetical protein